MSRAVCIRCGAYRESYGDPCPSCGHRPDGEGLLVAWLLSSEHLDAKNLEAAHDRIEAGEPIRPSKRMLNRARKALGRQLSSDPGLPVGQVLGVFVANIVFSPLLGWTLWFFWREERPRAALQALAVSAPLTVLFTGTIFLPFFL